MTREDTLGFARELIAWGIPVLVCKQAPDGDGMIPIRSWANITNAAQCVDDLDTYVHGEDALALIGGYGIDLIDVDVKDGGTIAPFGDFKHYGITRTPSGGYHYVIPSTGLKQKQKMFINGVFVGDYVGGTASNNSRRIGYLPGSYRPNKYGDKQYLFERIWDIEGAVLGNVEPHLRQILATAIGDKDHEEYVDESPERDPADGIHPKAREWIDKELDRLDNVPKPWYPGAYWDQTTFEVACALRRFGNSGWTGYSLDDAFADFMKHAPVDDVWTERDNQAKWVRAQETVGGGGHKPPAAPRSAEDDFEIEDAPVRVRDSIDVSNMKDAHDAVFRLVGREGTALAGLFRREGDLVYTPAVGDEGYVPLTSTGDDGPVQVRRMSATAFSAYLNRRYRVFKMNRGNAVPAMFPRTVAQEAVEAPELMEGLRPLRIVSHTPLLREDGTVLRDPGYDPGSGILYLPDRGLRVPDDDGGGLALLDEMLCDFTFLTEHDRANYFAALLTPLLRLMAPPPYPLFAIGAPTPGAGKSLLASVLRTLHGGVFRSEMVREVAEFRKQITSILDTTSGAVVTFDNVKGVLKSPVFEGLLTERTWTDRILGATQDRSVPNDRLWTMTGNNLLIGGDLRRRTIWITIDPGVEHPETRTNFLHPDLLPWVEEHRGPLLAALLSLVTRWDEAGRPVAPLKRTDSYGAWQQMIEGILACAGVPGEINHADSVREASVDDNDWSVFLDAVWRVWEDGEWQIKDVMQAVHDPDLDFSADDLPEKVVVKMRGFADQNLAASKVLGFMAQEQANRWHDGLQIQEAGTRRKTKVWRVVRV